jgi:nucleotide-binding universal stress UspA family protein
MEAPGSHLQKETKMLERIMVPLDGTRFAEAALPGALSLAKRDGAALRLVRVWQPMASLIDSADWIQQVEEWEERHREEDRRYMTEVARRLGEALGRTVSIKYLIGRPDEELARAAEEMKMDLVVMATHGHGPVSRFWLGSVADRYVRRSTVPVLLVRPAEDVPEVELAAAEPFRKILVPLDGSTLAEQALQKSVLVGSTPAGAEITLLSVVGFPVPMATPEGGVVLDSKELLEAQSRTAQDHLDRMEERIADWGCKVTKRVIPNPVTWKAIVDFATAGKYDVIAMATHGRGGAARVLLGSVADKVMRSSPVPTLLFHPERPEPKEQGAQEQLSAEFLMEWP